MPRRIGAKLNVMKINKEKLFKGEKGVYLDITLIETPNGKYGDWMVVQSQTKEEYDNGGKAPILGNGKNMGGGGGSPSSGSAPSISSDDLPY